MVDGRKMQDNTWGCCYAEVFRKMDGYRVTWKRVEYSRQRDSKDSKSHWAARVGEEKRMWGIVEGIYGLQLAVVVLVSHMGISTGEGLQADIGNGPESKQQVEWPQITESIVAAARAFTALPPKRRDRGLHFPSRHRRACLILSIMVVRVNGIRFNTGYKFTRSVTTTIMSCLAADTWESTSEFG